MTNEERARAWLLAEFSNRPTTAQLYSLTVLLCAVQLEERERGAAPGQECERMLMHDAIEDLRRIARGPGHT